MKTMKMLLERFRSFGPATFGKLYVDGVQVCYVLEDQIREQANTPVSDWKVHGKTAIPSTEFNGAPYRITLENSPRFGPDTMTVNNVVGFAGVRIHAGNSPEDTEGCPLLGMDLTPTGIANSRKAVDIVKRLIKDAIDRGDVVMMTVTNP